MAKCFSNNFSSQEVGFPFRTRYFALVAYNTDAFLVVYESDLFSNSYELQNCHALSFRKCLVLMHACVGSTDFFRSVVFFKEGSMK